MRDFIRLRPNISLYTSEHVRKGRLIILCTWLGAASKHIVKYTAVYQHIAPEARILILESSVPILVSSYARQQAALIPAVSVVLQTLEECSHQSSLYQNIEIGHYMSILGSDKTTLSALDLDNDEGGPKILLHMFSNGGTNTATQLLLQLHKQLHSPLPLIGMLYDSCPAKGTYWKDHKAMVYSLPKNIITWILGNIIIHIILIMLHTEISYGHENPARLLRRTLLDESKIKGRPSSQETREAGQEEATLRVKDLKGVRMCYLYSKSDQMVDWTDIRDHAAEAMNKGLQVEEILFKGSRHCAHFQIDENKYIEAMVRMWQPGSHHVDEERQTGSIASRL